MLSTCKTLIIDNESIAFPRLTLEDQANLAEAEIARRVKLARETGKERQLSPMDIGSMELDLKIKVPSVEELYAQCASVAFTTTVVRASLKKAGLAVERQSAVLAKLTMNQAMDLARALILDVQEELPSNEEDKANDPLPSTTPENGV